MNKYRKHIRIPEFDYRAGGAYFITICSVMRLPIFGKIENGKVNLSPIGEIVDSFWKKIPEFSSNCSLDQFLVMPNHLHGILMIDNPLCYKAFDDNYQPGIKPRSISSIIGSYKSSVTKFCNENYKNHDFYPSKTIWQQNFYEHVIRNERDLLALQEYIANNPLRWELDSLHIA